MKKIICNFLDKDRNQCKLKDGYCERFAKVDLECNRDKGIFQQILNRLHK